MIVPRHKKTEFLYLCDSRTGSVLSWMQGLRRRAENDPGAKKELIELCERIVAKKNRPSYSWYTPKPKDTPETLALKHETIASTLQCEDFELYNQMIEGETEPMPIEVFRLLGWAMGSFLLPDSNKSRYESSIPFSDTSIGGSCVREQEAANFDPESRLR